MKIESRVGILCPASFYEKAKAIYRKFIVLSIGKGITVS